MTTNGVVSDQELQRRWLSQQSCRQFSDLAHTACNDKATLHWDRGLLITYAMKLWLFLAARQCDRFGVTVLLTWTKSSFSLKGAEQWAFTDLWKRYSWWVCGVICLCSAVSSRCWCYAGEHKHQASIDWIYISVLLHTTAAVAICFSLRKSWAPAGCKLGWLPHANAQMHAQHSLCKAVIAASWLLLGLLNRFYSWIN